jgi:hypothetical protein
MAVQSLADFSRGFAATIFGTGVIAVALWAGAGGGPAWAGDTDQLESPTHRQVRVIKPMIDGRQVQLHTFATTAEGNLLAAVSEPGKPDRGYVLRLDAEGREQQRWRLPFAPSALAISPDAAIYVGGSGKLALLDDADGVAKVIDSPHVGDLDELREETEKALRESYERMHSSMAEQTERIQEQIDRIEEKPADDRSRLEQAQLSAFKQQLEMFEGMEFQTPELNDVQIDAAVAQSMSITSLAATDQDLFLCASEPGFGGYTVRRISRDLDPDSCETILDGLSGCCGQMDIQCCGDDLMVSENTRFRVGIYDRHGRAKKNFGKQDRTSRAGFGSCCNPMNSFALSDGTVVTAESSIGHIKRFDTDGELVAYIGKASIGVGCKHCALGHDPKRNLYFMMSQDKNEICVLASYQDQPATLAEQQLQQRQRDFFAAIAGQWQIDKQQPPQQSGNLLTAISALIRGQRSNRTEQPIESLEVNPDGTAKILAGMYKAYGEQVRLEVLAGPQPDGTEPNGSETGSVGRAGDPIPIAVSIDQSKFLEGTWKRIDDQTAVVEFRGLAPVTFVRSGPAKLAKADGDAEPGGDAQRDHVSVTDSVPPDNVELDDLFGDTQPATFESQMLKPKFEYKLLTRQELGKPAEEALNSLGAEGWEYCGKLGGKMMFKRLAGMEIVGGSK